MFLQKNLVNKNVIFFKISVIIKFLAATVSTFTDSFENTESYMNHQQLIVTLSLSFSEARDYDDDHLSSLVIKNELLYDQRIDNYDACYHFISKFSSIIEQYKNQNHLKNKRKFKKQVLKILKLAFSFLII